MTGILWIGLSVIAFGYIIYNIRRQIKHAHTLLQVLVLFWLSLVACAFFGICLLNGISLLQQ